MANTESAKKAPDVGILILDSTPASQQALRLLLSSEGWHVQVVTDAQQTLQQLLTGAWSSPRPTARCSQSLEISRTRKA
jgi:CheY-like chemotaxis protein